MILGEQGRDPVLRDQRREAVPGPRRATEERRAEVSVELRKMALHLETAAVLDARAARTADPTQVAVLRRRATQRRQEAARIRTTLAAHRVVPRGRSSPAEG